MPKNKWFDQFSKMIEPKPIRLTYTDEMHHQDNLWEYGNEDLESMEALILTLIIEAKDKGWNGVHTITKTEKDVITKVYASEIEMKRDEEQTSKQTDTPLRHTQQSMNIRSIVEKLEYQINNQITHETNTQHNDQTTYIVKQNEQTFAITTTLDQTVVHNVCNALTETGDLKQELTNKFKKIDKKTIITTVEKTIDLKG